MYKVRVNEETEYQIDISGKEISLDGNQVDWDQVIISKNRFHILKNNESYLCEVLAANAQRKLLDIKVNGKIVHVEIKDRFDELLHQLGMDKGAGLKVNIIKAPMPGLILKLFVKEGDEIIQGDSLLIIEAMKMENILKSPGSGKVKMVSIREQDAVEKNQTLIELS